VRVVAQSLLVSSTSCGWWVSVSDVINSRLRTVIITTFLMFVKEGVKGRGFAAGFGWSGC